MRIVPARRRGCGTSSLVKRTTSNPKARSAAERAARAVTSSVERVAPSPPDRSPGIDDHSRPEAGEVGDEAAQNDLASEPKTGDLLAPEALPEAALSNGRSAAEHACDGRQSDRHGPAPHPVPPHHRASGRTPVSRRAIGGGDALGVPRDSIQLFKTARPSAHAIQFNGTSSGQGSGSSCLRDKALRRPLHGYAGLPILAVGPITAQSSGPNPRCCGNRTSATLAARSNCGR